ncbi:tellurite resistance TerB family protein [Pusillimonas sp. CC-YST705]|uniref:Tellurite resistance TerB family protein n=1 Tax=Mesopusillimonas faecipullorum TaxID=2755040 RepID=A0ABS8CFV1_9BURK|nr:tellurite resistance TerB family protein [Mesopusillimonas faecipullorum]MCB5364684.1 tellurite resistance TerB family protein [Mesopusillimonas faecipullorum]
MSIQAMLQQLLQSGQGMLNNAAQPADTPPKGSKLGSFTGGALAGGALGMLMGNKKFRKIGGKVATYGGIAALGALAYRVYQNSQNKQQPQTAQGQAAAPVTPQAFAQLPAPEIEQHSRNVLAAMIAAAKSDGHIGPEEQQLLDVEFQKLQGSAQDQQWVTQQLASPADPAAIAKLAATPEQGAEIYLASVLVTDADSFMERAYLDELARQLNLAPELKQQLEQAAQQA